MLLVALVRRTLRAKTKDEVKVFIGNIFQNEYCSSYRAVNQNGILAVDYNTTLLAQMAVLSKQLVGFQLAQANAS